MNKAMRLEQKCMELTVKYGDPEHPKVLQARKELALARGDKETAEWAAELLKSSK